MASEPTSNTAQLPEWADSIIDHTGWRDAGRAYRFSNGRAVIVPAVRKRALGTHVAERAWPEGWTFSSPAAAGGAKAEEVRAVSASLVGTRIATLQHRFPGEPLALRRTA